MLFNGAYCQALCGTSQRVELGPPIDHGMLQHLNGDAQAPASRFRFTGSFKWSDHPAGVGGTDFLDTELS